MDIAFNCNVVVESLNSQNETIKNEKSSNASLSLWRNEFREIVLLVSRSPKPELKLTLQDVKIHSKFLKEGKSTIVLPKHKVRLLLSNCPPACLKKFFQVLSVKLFNFKKNIVSDQKKLIACLPRALDEISPLSEKDLNSVNSSKQKKMSNAADCKRKHPFCDQTNIKPVQPSAKKCMISLPADCLNNDQKHVINLIKQGKNVFFSGSAGTGKSYLLRHIIGMLPPTETFVTASTGVAACHIGGMTLHSFAGFHNVGPVDQLIARVQKNKIAMKQWKACKHLVIDEISMIDGDFFDCLEAVGRSVGDETKPFGGIQLIISGDFFQLPPVSKKDDKKCYCFQAKSWITCIDCCWELRKVYRQTDAAFINLLQDIRFGMCNAKTMATLKATKLNKLNQHGIIPTKLCCHVVDVKQINQSHLEKLSGKEYQYTAHDSSEHFSPVLDRLLPDTTVVTLKVGAQVMLTKNIDIAKKLVNGARGVVVGFTNAQQPLPVVYFLSGTKKSVELEKYTVKIFCDVTAIRKQLPLKLAWAISIHKSQGMSLDSVEMSLSQVFENGQAYVALSRATSLAGLRVLSIDSTSVRSNIDVLRFYRRLREMQKMSQPISYMILGR